MPSAAELLSTYERAESLEEAARALERLEGASLPANVNLGDLYDGLAEAAAESEDFPLAIRAQERAIKLGCEHSDVAEEMLAWYLLKDGWKAEGEAEFARLREAREGNPEILLVHASARLDSGDAQGALEAFDEALAGAHRAGDDDWVDQIREERRYARSELGLEPDEDDRLAAPGDALVELQPSVRLALAWFPRDQVDEALERWPSLNEDLSDPDAYCRSIEGTLRAMSADSGRNPSVAPLRVEALAGFAVERGLDPDSGKARARFAAELDRLGEAITWPPGRNEPCWCGSARKYKRCCGRR